MPSITVINHTEHMFRRSKKIEYIILHYSASTKSGKGAAQRTVNTLDKRGYSSDYAVDDYEIIQFADDPAKWASTACQAWSSKGTEAGRNAKNNNSVSIEMSSHLDPGGAWEPNDPKFKFTDGVLQNTAYLCKVLIQKYNIPQQNIIRHFDIMGKSCPGIIGWNRAKGSSADDTFRNFVASLYNGAPLPSSAVSYEYSDYTSPSGSSGGSSGGSGTPGISNAPINIPNVPNKVSRLSSATRQNDNVLKQSDGRKSEFETLRNTMVANTPEMGRDILMTSELYDSNILKGSQESKTERL